MHYGRKRKLSVYTILFQYVDARDRAAKKSLLKTTYPYAVTAVVAWMVLRMTTFLVPKQRNRSNDNVFRYVTPSII